MNVPTYKCVIMGDKRCGKTTFLSRHLSGEFKQKYVPTDPGSTNIYTLTFSSNRGPIRFDVWDWGKENEGLDRYPDDFYKDSQCAILMSDLDYMETVLNLTKYSRLFKICHNIPVAICGNKSDLKTDTFLKENYKKYKGFAPYRNYSQISVKTKVNIDGPFLYLARQLFDDFTLEFIQLPALELPSPVALAYAVPEHQDEDRIDV